MASPAALIRRRFGGGGPGAAKAMVQLPDEKTLLHEPCQTGKETGKGGRLFEPLLPGAYEHVLNRRPGKRQNQSNTPSEPDTPSGPDTQTTQDTSDIPDMVR